jgi:hypothetical protein
MTKAQRYQYFCSTFLDGNSPSEWVEIARQFNMIYARHKDPSPRTGGGLLPPHPSFNSSPPRKLPPNARTVTDKEIRLAATELRCRNPPKRYLKMRFDMDGSQWNDGDRSIRWRRVRA